LTAIQFIDGARRVLAVLVLVSLSPAILYWYLIHPLVGFWRRVGLRITYTVVVGIAVAVGYGLYRVRDALLGTDLGTHWPFLILGLALYAVAAALEVEVRRHLSFRILAGAPELSADPSESRLLRDGIYSRVRHPRYLGIVVGMLAMAVLVHHTGIYLLWAACLPALYLLVVLEERELRDRFGREYEEYCRKVPRLVPRIG